MSTKHALLLNAKIGTAAFRDSIPIPIPGQGEVLVKVQDIALNPIDPLYVAHPPGTTGRIIGSDFAGTIAAFGPSALNLITTPNHVTVNLQIGDIVAGFLQGACSVNPRAGAFAEYSIVNFDLVWRVPDEVAVEAAAGVNLCAFTDA
ncbi:hypothetical protein LTR62_002897 [Meristemomyces frigidus]|uniref:Alcohol dehydrogenase-like N-terminal domain-containing protein n=1 Tax=Meristemomyces frigidus TaxID=1508187 RepID=A0AAN7TXV1_9PEZI|nr:hypothetical protein LTR62_002897 [Meristemomyces frigidus]